VNVLHQARDIASEQDTRRQVYCVQFLNRGVPADEGMMIEAANDEDALDQARGIRLFTTREIWNGHRLVGVIPTL
jgi:hypothetical protein